MQSRILFAWSRLALVCAGVAIVFLQSAAMAATSVGVTKTTNAPNPVPSGQTFKYDLSYTCSSTTGSAHNVVLTDVLPSDIEFVSLTPTVHVATYTTPAVGSSGTVTVNLINPLPSGSAGIIPVYVRYKPGVTPNATVSLNTATIVGSDAAQVSSSASTTSSAASTWSVAKTGAAAATLGPAGVTYTMTLFSTGTSIGQLNLQNAVMVDTLPVGVLPADVLDGAGATVSGTGAAGNPVQLTWTLGTLSSITAQPAASKTVTIRYPASQFSDGQVVQNAATASGSPVGGALTNLGPATVNTTLSMPAVTRSLGKAASDTTVDIGQVFDWQLAPATTAAVSLDNYTITDTLPNNFTLQSVFTGTGYTGAPSGSFMTVQYETLANPGVFNTWPGGPYAVNQTLPVNALGLSAGVYVTAVKMNYGTIGTTFAVSATASNRPYLRGVITNPARNGTAYPAGTSGVTSENNATLTASYNGLALPSVPATATATLNTPAPAMTLAKATTNATPFLGAAFTWQLNPVNSGNTPLSSLVLTDTLPGNYTLQSVFTGNNYVNSPGGSFINIRYKTTANSSYTTWTGGPFAANVTLPVSALGLGAGVYLTAVEFNFGDVPLGFAASATATDRPALTGVVTNPTPNGTTVTDGSTSINSATLTGSYNSIALTPQTDTSTVTIPPTTKTATFTKAASPTTPWVGQSFGWQLRPASTGTAPLDNFTITDTLPVNFTLVSITPGSSYTNSPSGNFIAVRYKTAVNSNWTNWTGSPFAASSTAQPVTGLNLGVGEYVTAVEYNYGSVPVGFAASGTAANRPTLTGVVTNPARDGSTVTGGTTVSNSNATLTASYGGVAITPVTTSASATINSTAPAPTLTKTSSNNTPPIGQSYNYYLRPVCPANGLSNLTMVDTLPSKFTLVSITPGSSYASSPGGNFIGIRYKTTINSNWTTWTGSPFAASNTALPVSALTLGTGVYVTALEYNYGTVPASFAASNNTNNRVRLTGIVSNPARDGSTVIENDVITNPATLDATYNGTPLATVNASVDVTMTPTQASSNLTKAVSKATPAIGKVFYWRLVPANTGLVPLDSFILTDTLPSQFTLQSVATGSAYANSPTGNFITLRYKTNTNSSYTDWPGGPFPASNTALLVSALGLPANVYVTEVQFDYGTVPIGFASSGTTGNQPRLTGVVTNPARDASSVVAGAVITNSNATLTADYAGAAIAEKTASAFVTMTSASALAKTSSAATYDFGEAIIWRLRPQASGLALTNFSVTDTLPSQFELTSIYAGTGWTAYVAPTVYYTTTANPSFVVWPGGTLASGASRNVSALGLASGVYVTSVKFDYGSVANNFAASGTAASQPSLTGVVNKAARDGSTISTVDPITNITNNATIAATYNGYAQPASASATVTMKTPVLTTSLSKVAFPSTQQLGQPFDWQLSPAAATTPSTLSLNNFTITDTLPAPFELQSVFTGTDYANAPTGNFIAIRYKTTANAVWTNWAGSPFAANTTLNVTSLGLTAGVYVTDVEINYGTVAGNFAASATDSNKPRLTGVVNSPARNGAIIADLGTVTNSNATLTATYFGEAAPPQTASASVTLTTVKIRPSSVKTVPNLSYVPEGVIPFQVETWNDASSDGPMVNPVGTDLLPAEVDYMPGTFARVTTGTYNSAGLATPTLTVIPNFSGTRTLLRWQYAGSVPPNTRATVTFNVKVRAGTTSNAYTNVSGASAAPAINQEIIYASGVPDTLDLNGNGSTSDSLSPSAAAPFSVATSPAVDATKWVKGVLDKVYTKYPDYGITVAGGSINYKIDITNVGSVDLNNLMLIDILPAVGDVGVVDTSPRLSGWTPELTGSASVPIIVDNATIYYTTEPNPDRSEVGGPVTGNPPNWSTTPPADLTTIRAFKIVWDPSVVLAPGHVLEFNVPMRAPLEAADGTIAWNSFAWAADPTGFPRLAAEPNKVGVGALNTGKAIGNYVWLDENSDGYQDPGEPGLPNVNVKLYDSAGTVMASTWTDSSGHYLFSHLDAMDYFVRVDASTLPAGLTQTTLSILPNADFGNQDQSTGVDDYGYYVPATNSGADLTADFGYNYNPTADVNGNTGTCMIGDRIWLDLNGDGKQTPDEIGVSGVQLQLITAGPDGLTGTADDVIAATTTTDAAGVYRFDGLAPGAYQVKVSDSASASHDILSSAYNQTGDPDHFASSSILSNDNLMSSPIILGPGDVFLNADFGYHPLTAVLGTIGDFVWLDANASGTPTADPGEFGISHVTLALIKDLNGNGNWDSGEPIISSTITNASGVYQFAGLPLSDSGDGDPSDADYLVWVNDTHNVLAQPRQSYDKNGIASPNISSTSLSSGVQSVTDQDFSYVPASQLDGSTAVIGDQIWFDENRDGVLDPTELGIPSVLVELVDTLGRVIALTLTDADGYYFFGGLSPTATYSVRVAARNFLAGKPLAGLTNTYDANGGNDSVSIVDLAASGNDGNADPDATKNGLNLGQDFGYGPPVGAANQGSIGNLIWLDNNANGTCDGVNGADGLPDTDDDEPGIAGVTVDLFRDLNNNGQLDSGEPLIATTTTDSNGAYLFSGLPLTDGVFDPLLFATDPDASYVVDVSDRDSVLRGYWHTSGTPGTDNQSQVDPSAIVLTSANPDVLSADFGYYVEPAAIGNYLWVDTNGNGLQDEVGTGLANVEVILTITYPNGTVTTLKTLTNADGYYTFGNLLQDEDYTQGGGGAMPTFMISIPPGQAAMDAFTQTHIGIGSDPRGDSNNPIGTSANPVKGLTNVIGESSPSTMPTYDFGYFPTSELLSLGNRLWLDVNNNGIMDSGEFGLSNVRVDLLDYTGVTVQATTYTDANGYYRFDGLLPGDYTVRIPAENWTGIIGSPGGALDGTTPLLGHYSSSGCATLAETSGVLALTGIDHGVDNGSPAANGITSLVVTLAAGNQPTGEVDAGATGAGANGTNGDVRDNLALDFGFFSLGTIGDFVFNDANANGIQDNGETGLSGVTVTLYRPGYGPDGIPNNADDPSAVASEITLADGAYSFTGLLPGTYQVGFSTLAGYHRTLTDQGVDDTKDSDANASTGRTGDYWLPSGATNHSIDAGYYQPATIGDFVWNDVNANGVQDTEETGLAGVLVSLYRPSYGPDGIPNTADDANAVATATTPASGAYSFSGLMPGTYQVSFGTLSSYTRTQANQGADDTKNSDANAGSGLTGTYVLAAGETNQTIDAGYYPSCSIGNLVWEDLNNNGLVDVGESGFDGVTVELWSDVDGNGVFEPGGADSQTPLSTITASGGHYSFTDVALGKYFVVIPTPPALHVLSSTHTTILDNRVDNDDNGIQVGGVGALTVSPVIDLGAGETDNTVDFGFIDPGIGNLVWLDLNHNGKVDDGEPGIPGVLVELYNSAGSKVMDTTTDANGFYLFTGQAPESYTVRIPESNFGTGGALEHYRATTAVVVASDNQTDDDNNGTQPLGPGHEVSSPLIVLTGAGEPTDADTETGRGNTLDNGDDADADMTVDFGFSPNLSLGNRVFADNGQGLGGVANDGILNGSEVGIAGVVVKLFAADLSGNATGVSLATQTTDANGYYRFDDLTAGTYVAVIDLANSANLTNQLSSTGASTNTTLMGDLSDHGKDTFVTIDTVVRGIPSTAVTLVAGLQTTGEAVGSGQGVNGPNGDAYDNLSLDFGFIPPGAISGYVYAGNTPLETVTLALLDADGNPVPDPNSPGDFLTTVTDVNGFYTFTGLRPGDYRVVETQPSGYSSFDHAGDGGDLNIIGDVTRITVITNQTNTENNFFETSNCPSDWATWIGQRVGQTAVDNPDADAYDNLAEFAFAMPSNSGVPNNWIDSTAWMIRPSTYPAYPDSLEGVFVRPVDAPLNVTYTLQYAANPGDSTVWTSITITPEMISTIPHGDCTETVIIHDLETLTGLTGGKGVVRIKADLQEDPLAQPPVIDHTSYAEVEGWKETALRLNCSTYNNPFLRETGFTGTVSAVNGQQLTFATSAGSVNLSTLLTSGISYYVEVTDGVNEGQRFDVDVASSGGNVLALANDMVLDSLTAPFNTLTGAPPVSLIGGHLALRRHWTLAEMFPPSGFEASGSQATADEVQVFAGGWKVYWLYNGDGPARWVEAAAGLSDKGSTVIPSGQGVFFNNRTLDVLHDTLLAYGEVRANDFVRPLGVGYNLVGGGYPVDQSATGTSGRAMNLADGFFGSLNFSTADSFFIWNGDSSPVLNGYTTYYLLNGALDPRWIKVGDAKVTSRGNEILLLGNRAAFIRTANGVAAYAYPSPWTP